MDPDMTLARLRVAAAKINAMLLLGDESTELAEAFEALDAWLSKGGFLPRAWGGLTR